MARQRVLCCPTLNICLILLFLGISDCTSMADPISNNSFTIYSFTYPETRLKPYAWRYIRVELPQWFSSVSIALESDVDLDLGQVAKVGATPKSMLPLICFRDGSLPLPDFSDKALDHLVLGSLSNGSVRAIEGVQNAERCYPMEKRIILKLTNEQIAPGVWYVGLFNGIGAIRTQSKMIIRGSSYSFSANVSVEGCMASNFWGQFCNQSIESLSCSISDGGFPSTTDSYNTTVKDVISCSSVGDSCHGDNETRVFSLEVTGMAQQFTIAATNIRVNGSSSSFNSNNNTGDVVLRCYARFGAIALASMHDFSGDLAKGPLTVPLPKAGRWYITIAPVNLTTGGSNGVKDGAVRVCYSLAWRVGECPFGKAGFNCTWDVYTLQIVLRKNPSLPFESFYVPSDEKVSSNSANFPLRPLLSNSSLGGQSGVSWTYLVLDIPRGAAGGNLHFRLKSDREVGSEIYIRYGGLPSADTWDYYYINKTKSSDGSMFFTLSNSSKEVVDFYILYAREGTWSFGLKNLNSSKEISAQSTLSISLERCPRKCSAPHGSCDNFVDASGLTIYSYCSCDRTHGGIDCSIELVSHQGHIWQSIALIGSNAAAILPAYRALRQKAFAEWVIFTASGISSALYHACDVGTWCALNFRVLQFMDFWLSFMAVVSTFVFMAAIDEASKRTIHAAVSILTALMAISGATRSANIVLVIAIGATGLLVGWLIELVAKYRSLSCSAVFCFRVPHSWQGVKVSVLNVVKVIMRRFRWGYMLAGFVALAMAGVSWKLETSQTYWIWHSIWHVSIYTSSFLFLCSMVKPAAPTTENLTLQNGDYELTRQNSVPRGGE